MARLIALLSLIALLGGCGGAGEGRLPVSGTVKNADGTVPTGESALVWFEPVAEGRAASGSIQEDGSFSLMTQTPGDGVAPGDYKVVLKIWKNYRAQTPAVPKQYTDAATTPLEATVDTYHTHFDFVVEK
jgi:hypothetical protein